LSFSTKLTSVQLTTIQSIRSTCLKDLSKHHQGRPMKIKTVHIKNLRAIKEETVHFDNYTCFVGANGAGKSTVLLALNVFFRDNEGTSTDVTSLSIEDFHQKDTSNPIEVIVTFHDLSEEAKEDFKDYVRQDQLVISVKAEFNAVTARADVKQFGQRLAMLEFEQYFREKGDGARVDRLKEIYTGLQGKFNDLPRVTTGAAMEQALNAYEAERPEQCSLIPSEDEFYGISKGKNRLERHIQWVYVPAVKDATSEQSEGKTTALGKLLARTVRSKVNFSEKVNTIVEETRASYQKLLDQSQDTLDGVSASLNERLAQWAHPEASIRVSWQHDTAKSIRIEEPFAKVIAGEGHFEGELARFGHGLQRSFLLAMLQELASSGNSGGPKLVLACEEPELYQHPPQARHLAGVLWTLADQGAQVFVSTHSPLFVLGESFQNVRLVRRDTKGKDAKVYAPNIDVFTARYASVCGEKPPVKSASLAKVANILQPALTEMFFTQRLVLVEGLEDAAYIYSWLKLRNLYSEFRKAGCHVVAVGGKSELISPAIIAEQLCIPTYVVFDTDIDKFGEQNQHKHLHERDNRALLSLCGGDVNDPFPDVCVEGARFTSWPCDLGKSVKDDFVHSLGQDAWDKVVGEAHSLFGNAGSLKKNTMLIGAKLAIALDKGGQSASLDRLCNRLVNF